MTKSWSRNMYDKIQLWGELEEYLQIFQGMRLFSVEFFLLHFNIKKELVTLVDFSF